MKRMLVFGLTALSLPLFLMLRPASGRRLGNRIRFALNTGVFFGSAR